jgi:hypothetical protein
MADLAQQLLNIANKGASELNEADRSALLQATYKLSSALESPVEQIFRLCFVCLPKGQDGIESWS